MENKFDKQVREKLKDVQLPFDEKAWQEMQKLLDGQKRQRASLYWWFGGITILLLVGFGAYLLFESNNNTISYTVHSNQNALSSETTYVTEHHRSMRVDNENAESGSNAIRPDNKQHTDIATGGEPSKVPNKQNLSSAGTMNDKTLANPQTFSLRALHSGKTMNKETAQTTKDNNRFLYSGGTPSFLSSVVEERLQTTGTAHGSTESVVEITTDKSSSLVVPDALRENVSVDISPPISESPVGDPPQADTISADDKSEEDIYNRPSKKRFHYSLGIITTATSTIGRARSDKISCFVGLTNDFLFFKRFALSAGVAYSQAHFTIVNPTSEHFEIPPSKYSSFITEIIIPNTIKIYPVSMQHFRMYVYGGIVHHIKLRETFKYTKRKVNPAPNPNPNPGNPVTPTISSIDFPTQTDFDGSSNVKEDFQINTSGGNATGGRTASTADFSINKANRYYASMNTGIGLEYVLKNKWIFFTEAIYLRSIQDIGVQDVKKHNLGASGGIRVAF